MNFVLVAFRCIQKREEVMRSRGDTELSPEFQEDLEAEFLPTHACVRNEHAPDVFTFSESIIPAKRAKF